MTFTIGDPQATFGWLAERLSGLGLAYLHIIDPRIKGDTTLHEGRDPVAASFIRKHYTGTIIAAGGFDGPEAKEIVERGTRILSRSRGGSRPIPISPNGCVTTGR